MTIFTIKDKTEQSCYIITNQDEAFIIDPRGNFNEIKSAIGNCSLKAIFLTKFKTDSIPLIAALSAQNTQSNTPVFVAESNAVYINKVSAIWNLSMINFVFVRKSMQLMSSQLKCRIMPVLGTEQKGFLLINFNNIYFTGALTIDKKLVKKVYELGATHYYNKLIKILAGKKNNIIYPELKKPFLAIELIKDNLKYKTYFQS